DALMRLIDEVAMAEKRTVLVLDTVTGSTADRLYRRLGWQESGPIPDYALMPTGELCSTTYFYKHVRANTATSA
ncbi:MAG: GNAT family N-acetyltransferase, partial [Casimicrobium sp.]